MFKFQSSSIMLCQNRLIYLSSNVKWTFSIWKEESSIVCLRSLSSTSVPLFKINTFECLLCTLYTWTHCTYSRFKSRKLSPWEHYSANSISITNRTYVKSITLIQSPSSKPQAPCFMLHIYSNTFSMHFYGRNDWYSICFSIRLISFTEWYIIICHQSSLIQTKRGRTIKRRTLCGLFFDWIKKKKNRWVSKNESNRLNDTYLFLSHFSIFLLCKYMCMVLTIDSTGFSVQMFPRSLLCPFFSEPNIVWNLKLKIRIFSITHEDWRHRITKTLSLTSDDLIIFDVNISKWQGLYQQTNHYFNEKPSILESNFHEKLIIIRKRNNEKRMRILRTETV